jgi:hypothetical protein
VEKKKLGFIFNIANRKNGILLQSKFNNIMKQNFSILLIWMMSIVMLHSSCDKTPDVTASSSVLIITNGAQTVTPDGKISYEAVIASSDGSFKPATGVTWSVTKVNTDIVGSFSGNVFSATTIGESIINASVTVNGVTLTATAIVGVATPTLFTVSPPAIMWSTGAGTIPLQPVYIGTKTSSSYTYTSSNPAIASVSATGEVTFLANGSCNITVTANDLEGKPTVSVPVMVIGAITVDLPITRVVVTPASKQLFRGDEFTYSAKAFNNTGEKSATFTWKSEDTDVATIDANGKVKAVGLGECTIYAIANGITGQSSLVVYPDTIIEVTPFAASISPGKSLQFTAAMYKINHSTLMPQALALPSNLKWEIPTYGMSAFDIATVDQTGKVTMKSDALPGMPTYVVAYLPTSETVDPGVSSITAGLADNCDCGADVLNLASINVASTSVNISITSGNLSFDALPVGKTPSGATLNGVAFNYCSDNTLIANFSNGVIIASGQAGTTTVTVCRGSVTKKITVNVTL